MPKFIIWITALLMIQSHAQEYEESHFFVDKYFLIIYSSKSYDTSEKIALKAQQVLDLKYDKRGFQYNKKTNLLESQTTCDCGEVHDYWGRGNEESSTFLSVEKSDFYPEFNAGYFIVVAAHDSDFNIVNSRLENIKEFYPDAYIKKAKIYIGCTH